MRSLTQMDANISILQTQWNDDILGEECSHSPSVWLQSDFCFDSRAVQRKSWLFNLILRMSKTQEHSYHWLAIIYCLSGPTKSSLKCPWSPVRAKGEKNRSVLALEWKCSLSPWKEGKITFKNKSSYVWREQVWIFSPVSNLSFTVCSSVEQKGHSITPLSVSCKSERDYYVFNWDTKMISPLHLPEAVLRLNQ